MTEDDLITIEMENILKNIDQNRWISFSKSDTDETFKAKDKLRAFGLIERHGKLSWQLTEEGYKAIELGGFFKWKKQRRPKNKVITFVSKFWWAVIIPVIVAFCALAIEYKWFMK